MRTSVPSGFQTSFTRPPAAALESGRSGTTRGWDGAAVGLLSPPPLGGATGEEVVGAAEKCAPPPVASRTESAGELGRGFAVVSKEMTELSANTRRVTQNIKDTVVTFVEELNS